MITPTGKRTHAVMPAEFVQQPTRYVSDEPRLGAAGAMPSPWPSGRNGFWPIGERAIETQRKDDD